MVSYKKSISPLKLKECLPASKEVLDNVGNSRIILSNILKKTDNRFIMIVGPCSFHDPKSCLEYAEKLKLLAEAVSSKIFIVMRVYLEKPRSNRGWKGYINDPNMNNTFCIEKGFYISRKFMIDLCEINLPIATEILNPYAYLYFDDLLSWGAIGARTTESQPHREIASGLPMPIGFKNAFSGEIKSAIKGISFSSRPQVFLGMSPDGSISVLHTQGNSYGHLVLRGGSGGRNYHKANLEKAEGELIKLKIPANIIIDCSHGNSSKNHNRQEIALNEVMLQKTSGNSSIIGVMIESFLESGNQAISADVSQLNYGLSVTDACIDWENTERLILDTYERLNIAIVEKRVSARHPFNIYTENFPMPF